MASQESHRDAVDVAGTLQLPPAIEAPARAREFVSRFCSAAELPAELCQTAALLTSELVTNAVVHGRSRAALRILSPPGRLRISVHDDDPRLPEVGPSPRLDASNGRGLHIVATLADCWGVEAVPGGGKAVWFELDVPTGASPS